MLRQGLLSFFMLCMVATPCCFASTFGYSVNINFGAEQPLIRRGAGVFRDRVWNGFDASSQNVPSRMTMDVFGDNSRTNAFVEFSAPTVEIIDSIKPDHPDDGSIMRGFIDSPSTIKLINLDQIVPAQDGPITYSVILYTFGGREGEKGSYRVNGRLQDRVDTADFPGRLTKGINGNTLVFEHLDSPSLLIETDGFGPVNAMSLVYCRPGDFNGDGNVDALDLDDLSAAVKSKSREFAFDVNFDLVVDFNDVLSWIKCSKGTCIGDVNLDGSFDSSDLVQLFSLGAYETGEEATWVQGDWDGDCKFDSSDLLVAFQEGCYEVQSAFAVGIDDLAGSSSFPSQFSSHVSSQDLSQVSSQSVPEPSSGWLIVMGSIGWLAARRRRPLSQ